MPLDETPRDYERGPRRFPLSYNKFKTCCQLGTATIVLLVVLRMCLGFHFLYEGVWKITHPEFSAEMFLLQAKGPAAPLFHAFIPDLEGRTRLKIEPMVNHEETLTVWREKCVGLDRGLRRARDVVRKPAEKLRDDLKAALPDFGFNEEDEDSKKEHDKLAKICNSLPGAIVSRFNAFDDGEAATQVLITGDFNDMLHGVIVPADPERAKPFVDAWNKIKKDAVEQFAAVDARRLKALGIYSKYANRLDAAVAQKGPAVVAAATAEETRDEVSEAHKKLLGSMKQIENEYLAALGEAYKEENKGEAPKVGGHIPGDMGKYEISGRVVTYKSKDKNGNVVDREVFRVEDNITGEWYTDTWNDLLPATVKKYGLDEVQTAQAAVATRAAKDALRGYIFENYEDIEMHNGSRKRHDEHLAGGNRGSEFQKKRTYDEGMKLRKEATGWLKEMDAIGSAHEEALWGILTDEQKAKGGLPTGFSMLDLINFAVTYGLTAIGICLLIGLCTRPAAIGGGLFMFSVILTQPGWPTIYPHAPPVVGHSLLINKDFIEMVALFLISTTAVGRWGGLDYFAENWFCQKCCGFLNKKEETTDAETK